MQWRCLCSTVLRTITYKGQLKPDQLQKYYHGDLDDDRFTSYMGLVSRWSLHLSTVLVQLEYCSNRCRGEPD